METVPADAVSELGRLVVVANGGVPACGDVREGSDARWGDPHPAWPYRPLRAVGPRLIRDAPVGAL